MKLMSHIKEHQTIIGYITNLSSSSMFWMVIAWMYVE